MDIFGLRPYPSSVLTYTPGTADKILCISVSTILARSSLDRTVAEPATSSWDPTIVTVSTVFISISA